jgi:integrase
MATFKFTARSFPPVPNDGQIDYWDQTLPGFGMRVSVGGTRTWVVMYRYNGTKRRMKIANYPGKKLAEARAEARDAIRKAEMGLDPASERKVVRVRLETVEDLANLYIERYAKVRKRSWKKDEQILNREVLPHIGRKRVVDVRRTDIRNVIDRIIERKAPVRANHTLQVMRKMFNWAIADRDMEIINPAAKIPMPGEVQSRVRYLEDHEFAKFWNALKCDKLGVHGMIAFQLISLTGQREMEVLKMKWTDIDLENRIWIIPGDVAKNKLANAMPLTPFVFYSLLILEDMKRDEDIYVFQSDTTGENVRRVFLEKRIIKIREEAKLEDFTIHDLRRTAATYFGLLNVDPFIKKKILNHSKRKSADATDIYDRFEYIDQKRSALESWETYALEMAGVTWWKGEDAFGVVPEGNAEAVDLPVAAE